MKCVKIRNTWHSGSWITKSRHRTWNPQSCYKLETKLRHSRLWKANTWIVECYLKGKETWWFKLHHRCFTWSNKIPEPIFVGSLFYRKNANHTSHDVDCPINRHIICLWFHLIASLAKFFVFRLCIIAFIICKKPWLLLLSGAWHLMIDSCCAVVSIPSTDKHNQIIHRCNN